MLISSRCSILTGQFAQWRGHGKSYCVGVRRFKLEAWLFVLAHRARLPDTVDFVLHDLFKILLNVLTLKYKERIQTKSSRLESLAFKL